MLVQLYLRTAIGIVDGRGARRRKSVAEDGQIHEIDEIAVLIEVVNEKSASASQVGNDPRRDPREGADRLTALPQRVSHASRHRYLVQLRRLLNRLAVVVDEIAVFRVAHVLQVVDAKHEIPPWLDSDRD